MKILDMNIYQSKNAFFLNTTKLYRNINTDFKYLIPGNYIFEAYNDIELTSYIYTFIIHKYNIENWEFKHLHKFTDKNYRVRPPIYIELMSDENFMGMHAHVSCGFSIISNSLYFNDDEMIFNLQGFTFCDNGPNDFNSDKYIFSKRIKTLSIYGFEINLNKIDNLQI